MRRILFLLAALCLYAHLAGAVSLTTIQDTVTTADGSLMNGNVYISWPTFTIGGSTVAAGQRAIIVINGVVSVLLAPTPSGVVYSVAMVSQGTTTSACWSVPSSSTPVTISAVTAACSFSPSVSFPVSQIGQSGATSNQVIAWNSTAQQWQATTLSAASGVTSFNSRTGAVTPTSGDYAFGLISGFLNLAQIAQGGAAPSQVLQWSGSAWTPATLSPGGVTSFNSRSGAVTPATNDYSFAQLSGLAALTQIAQSAATTGQVIQWNGSNWVPATPASGGVSSFNGRTGAIAPATSDYSFSQLNGYLALAQIPQAGAATNQVLQWNGTNWAPATPSGASGITGSTANTYIPIGASSSSLTTTVCLISGSPLANLLCPGSVSSADTTTSGAVDLTGKTSLSTVTLQANDSTAPYTLILPAAAPIPGQYLTLSNVTGSIYQLGYSVPNPGSMLAQMGDLLPSGVSTRTLSVGASCSPATPCNTLFGTAVVALTSASSATLSGSGGGYLFVYVTAGGGGDVTVDQYTFSGSYTVTPVSGIIVNASASSFAFPDGSFPIAIVVVASGAISAIVDDRAPNGAPTKWIPSSTVTVADYGPGEQQISTTSIVPIKVGSGAASWVSGTDSTGNGGNTAVKTITISGALTTDFVHVNLTQAPSGSGPVVFYAANGYISASNTLTVYLYNVAGVAPTGTIAFNYAVVR